MTHQYPVSLTLAFIHASLQQAPRPVTITDLMEDGSYMVEDQETGESFFAKEIQLLAKPADYLQLARAYELAARGLESESRRLSGIEDTSGALRTLRESTACYRLGAEVTNMAAALLRQIARIN